ncbi:hypothetical protein QUF74_10585 [Candidatus Halobeggiatoa sp. HSG11]|nr:hypothetical protein [Candidatus Halobeggiatoa sp. HSG11]
MQRYIYVVLLFFMSASLTAQEHHYWSNQFGSRSALMGGAVVGGVRDTSAGYYNPGALGFVKKSSFSVTANSYQMEFVSVDNGAGTGEPRELESQELNIVPLLISGTAVLGNHTFGYSLVGKAQSSTKLSGRRAEIINVFDSNPDYLYPPSEIEKYGDYSGITFDGPEDYRGQFSYNSKVSEMLGGASWATDVLPYVSVGVSGFLALRSQRYSISSIARAANTESGFIASEDKFSDADFYNIRTFFKFGVAADFDELKLGATLTTPSISLFGNGSVGAGLVRFREDQPLENNLADDRQNDLDATYKSPMALALGMEYMITGQTIVAATIEWFAEQSNYEVMTPASRDYLVGDTSIKLDSKDVLTVKNGASSIVNFAFAIEHALSSKMTGYFSFRTDFETFQGHENELEPLGINNWNIYHTTLGIVRKKKDSESAIGLVYSYGSQSNFKQLANLDPSERQRNDFMLASENQTSADYSSLSLIIGYTYFFK